MGRRRLLTNLVVVNIRDFGLETLLEVQAVENEGILGPLDLIFLACWNRGSVPSVGGVDGCVRYVWSVVRIANSRIMLLGNETPPLRCSVENHSAATLRHFTD